MSGMIEFYILFDSHHDGLLLNKRLKEAGVKCTIAPTPREASSFCGMSLLVTPENIKAARQVIEESGLPTKGIAEIPRKTGVWNKTC